MMVLLTICLFGISLLDQEDIQLYIDSNTTENENGLVALWKFNSGDGDILYDHSGNLNHGTIHGATWGMDILG